MKIEYINQSLITPDNLSPNHNLGQVLVNLLHYLDPYHVEKAIGLTVPVVHLSTWEQFKRFSIVVGAILLIPTLIVFIAISII